MKKSLSGRKSALAMHAGQIGPNMTPMVDVVMVILIFFMASAAFLGPEWLLKTALPSRSAEPSAPAAAPPPLVLRLDIRSGPEPFIVINGGPATRTADLSPALQAAMTDRRPADVIVLVVPEPDAPYEAVVRVHELCAELGIEKIGLGEPQAPPPTTNP